MKVYVGMGVKNNNSEKENKEVKKLNLKIAELEKENTNLVAEKEKLNLKIAELEKSANK